MSASAAYLRDAGFSSSVRPCSYGFQMPGPVAAELIRALMFRVSLRPLRTGRQTFQRGASFEPEGLPVDLLAPAVAQRHGSMRVLIY